MFIRHLYKRCNAGSGERNGFSARWFWSEFDEVIPNEHEGLKISDSLKSRLKSIKTEPEIGESIQISSTGTLYCNLSDDRYDISSHTPKIKYELNHEAKLFVARHKIVDYISPIFVYKQLKKEESSLKYPDIVVDMIFHELNELEVAAKKFGLPYKEKHDRVIRSLESSWRNDHGPPGYI